MVAGLESWPWRYPPFRKGCVFGPVAAIVPAVIVTLLGIGCGLRSGPSLGKPKWDKGHGKVCPCFVFCPFLARIPLFKGDGTKERKCEVPTVRTGDPTEALPKTDSVTKEIFGQIADEVGIRADSQDLKNRPCLASLA